MFTLINALNAMALLCVAALIVFERPISDALDAAGRHGIAPFRGHGCYRPDCQRTWDWQERYGGLATASSSLRKLEEYKVRLESDYDHAWEEHEALLANGERALAIECLLRVIREEAWLRSRNADFYIEIAEIYADLGGKNDLWEARRRLRDAIELLEPGDPRRQAAEERLAPIEKVFERH